MSTIVITGSAGLLGSNLSKRFLSLGYKVLGIDNLVGGYYTNMPLDHNNFVYYDRDILDNFELSRIFKFYNDIELVIHCAALPHEGLSVFSPKTVAEVIYSGTASVCSAAIANEVPYFINTSSMARYGVGEPPFKESDEVVPVDPYGLAKVHAEQHLNLMSDIHGIKVYHMVPHNVCGPGQCYSDPYRNVMSIFANRRLKDKPIYIYGDGEQLRSFSHITDCVDAFEVLWANREQVKNKEVFNIGPDDGTEITIKELAILVSKYCNKEADIIHLPPRPREVKHAWVSTNKAKQILNYKTYFNCEETISDTVNWIRKSIPRDFNYHLNLEIVNSSTPETWTKKLFND